MASSTIIASTLRKHQKKILGEWVQTLHGDSVDSKRARISPQELNVQAEEFLQLLDQCLDSSMFEARLRSLGHFALGQWMANDWDEKSAVAEIGENYCAAYWTTFA